MNDVDIIEFLHTVPGTPACAVESFHRACLSFSNDACPNTRHPADWPDHSERAHQDALWFCSGGDQLL